MQKPLKKIGLLILVILILPISAFFIYQFASLNETEEEINRIYVQQLETILYSINQYSEDVVSTWANNLNMILAMELEDYSDRINELLIDNPSIISIFLTDTNFTNTVKFSLSEKYNNLQLDEYIATSLFSDKILLNKLVDYFVVGYQKIEAVGQVSAENLNVCIFIVNNSKNNLSICAIVFDPNEFVNKNLISKISQVCGEKFVLAVINETNQSIIHSCDKLDLDELATKKNLWLIPGFSLGIKMKSGNLKDLVVQRYYENAIILGSLVLILLIGIGLIYQNIKKELRLTQLKSDFISNVSHELRTPLSLIGMYSETLVLDRLKNEEKKKEYYSVINNETNRLSKIVNTILNFSKMESGTREYQFQKINLVNVNNEVLNTYDYHIKSKGFKFSIKTKLEEVIIVADKDAISESIINLIENAIKYCGEKKEFEIRMGHNDLGSFWEIEDFGIGISNDDQKKIFEKFYRVSSGLVNNTKGTGLGLSLVKQIMHAHEAEIRVKSSIGKGSIFTLQFNKKFKN